VDLVDPIKTESAATAAFLAALWHAQFGTGA
jgi:hypothetical protein